jgi:uncharacterized membrane protein YccC
MRAALATIIPLAVGQFAGIPSAGSWMSLGGFNAALSDRGGAYGTRARTMALLLFASVLAIVAGTLASHHFISALVVTFVVTYAACVLRVKGNPGISIGGAAFTCYVVALAIAPAQYEWFSRAAYMTAGGVWAMIIALLLWPLRPYRPARKAVADCYRALAGYVDDVANTAHQQDTTEWPVLAHVPATITEVRTALEESRLVLVQLRRGRPGTAERGERLLVLNESADQIFGHIVAASETLATIRGNSRVDVLHQRSVATLQMVAATARALAAGVEEEKEAPPIVVPWSGDDIRALMKEHPGAESYEQFAAIIDRAAQFAASASLSVDALNGGIADLDAVDALVRSLPEDTQTEEPSFWDPLRALVSPGSLIARFALRVAVVTTIAVAITEALDIKRGYWITLTVFVILQPYTGVTFTRALQRVAGTVLGGVLAAGLGTLFHDPWAILVIAAVFVMACVALLPVNYAAFSVFLTPTFVLLAEASAGEWDLAPTRVLNTLLGGALALLGSRALWPSSERERFPSYGAAALRANSLYLSSVLTGFDDRGHEAGETMRSARRRVGLATANAEESLQRALTEVHGDQRKIAPALTLLAYSRRFTATVAALAVSRHAVREVKSAELAAFCSSAVEVIGDLSNALDDSRVPREMAPLETKTFSPLIRARLERLSRQIKTMHDAVTTLAS